MENEIPVNRVEQIHGQIQGQKLKVKANMGRSRIVERTNALVMAHPSLFFFIVEDLTAQMPAGSTSTLTF